MAMKNFNFKNPRWRTADTLERPVVHHISRFFDSQVGGCPSSWIFEIVIFFTAVHFTDTLCVIAPNFMEISRTVIIMIIIIIIFTIVKGIYIAQVRKGHKCARGHKCAVAEMSRFF